MATKKTPKIGTNYSFTKRNGEDARGKLVRFEDKANGTWAVVNVAGRNQAPILANVRPPELR